MAWRIEFDPSAARELARLDPPVARRILRFLHERVAHLDDPRSVGERLKGDRFSEFWKHRVGDYRIIASMQDREVLILVVRIGNRREVYRR